jgi:aminoglycoside phosphotransferase (APT) family kinase protein
MAPRGSGLSGEMRAILEAATTTDAELKRLYKRVTIDASGVVKKKGQAFRLRREAEAMRYVRQHTSIPVPEVIDVHLPEQADEKENEQGWFTMQQLDGSQYDVAWPSMIDGAKSESKRQLKGYLAELHALKPDVPGFIGSCSGGQAYDSPRQHAHVRNVPLSQGVS